MKFKFSLLFLFGALAAQAADTTTPLTTVTTANGYDRSQFCSGGAKRKIKEFDQITKAEVDKLNILKKNINDLSAQKTLISDFLKIRNDFVDAYQAITTEKNVKSKFSTNITNFKKLLNSSMVLTAVNTLAQNHSDKKLTLSDICKLKENSVLNFCSEMNGQIFKYDEKDIKVLEQTIQNVYAALDNTDKDEELKTNLTAIYNSIPDRLAPAKILEDLESSAPHLVAAISNSKNKDDLLKCFDNSNESCKNLLEDKNSRSNLKDILTQEMHGFQKDIIEKKLDEYFGLFDSGIKEQTKIMQDLMDEKSKLFIAHFDAQDNEKNKKLTAAGFNQQFLNDFKNVCTSSPEKEIDPKACGQFSKKMISVFEAKMKDLDEQLNEAKAQLDTHETNASALAVNEKMKQYVAQKYLRTCSNPIMADVTSNITCPCLRENEEGTNQPGDNSMLGQLNSKISAIIGRIAEKNPVAGSRGELGPFSKEELKIFSNYCDNTSAREKYKDICNDIFMEANAIRNIKESKEWDDFNNKYWVEYSKSSKKGYEVYEKKGNARIFGEGLSQSINKIYPAWFSYYQLNSQIDIMTNQSLYQKQMMYMYSPDSPWMATPYFQGAYYPGSTQTTQGFNFIP